VGSASHMMHVLLEADPEIDLGLAEHVGKSKSKQAGKRASQHAPDEQRPHHDDCRWRLMTGEAEQVATVVNEFVNVHAGEN